MGGPKLDTAHAHASHTCQFQLILFERFSLKVTHGKEDRTEPPCVCCLSFTSTKIDFPLRHKWNVTIIRKTSILHLFLQLCVFLNICRLTLFSLLSLSLETSSSVMVYMDTTTTTTRTTSRPTTVSVTTTTARTTTTNRPTTTTALAPWTRTTSTVVPLIQTVVEGLVPEEDYDRAPPSSKLPNIRVEYCNPLVMMDISWPKTKQGMVAKMPCPPGTIGNYFCFIKS